MPDEWSYLSPAARAASEFKEQGSSFLGRLAPASSTEEAGDVRGRAEEALPRCRAPLLGLPRRLGRRASGALQRRRRAFAYSWPAHRFGAGSPWSFGRVPRRCAVLWRGEARDGRARAAHTGPRRSSCWKPPNSTPRRYARNGRSPSPTGRKGPCGTRLRVWASP